MNKPQISIMVRDGNRLVSIDGDMEILKQFVESFVTNKSDREELKRQLELKLEEKSKEANGERNASDPKVA